jgi:Outer membrane protein W
MHPMHPSFDTTIKERPMKASALALTALALSFGTASAACAADISPWVLRVGVHTVNPKSNNGTLAGMKATVESDTTPTFSLEYMFDRHWGGGRPGFSALPSTPCASTVCPPRPPSTCRRRSA